MYNHYRLALLDPRPAKWAETLEFLAATPVLGVEVTVPELAAACSLGNLDPQHSGQDASTSAVEAAVTWPLPPAGAWLATVRPDSDAYGAMAVLQLRAAGADITGQVAARIAAVGAADRSRSEEASTRVSDLSAFRAACLSTRDPQAGVALAVEYLLTGRFAGMEQVRDRERVAAEQRETAEVARTATLAGDGRIAVVESTSRYAVKAAYQRADVVVVVNPAFRRPGAADDEPAHRKITLAQARLGLVDLPAAFADLAAREPGWGGSPTVGGSPQGTASTIPTQEIVAAVAKHLS